MWLLKKVFQKDFHALKQILMRLKLCLTLAPETNGQVAVKAWAALEKITGRDHQHLALPKADEKIRFRDIQAQPRKIISSPTWSVDLKMSMLAITPVTLTFMS